MFSVSLTPEAPTIKSSEGVHFVATVDGEPVGEVTYAWYVDDVLQDGEVLATFDFDPVDKVGQYDVKVEATDEAPVTMDDTETVIVLSEVFESIEALLTDIKTDIGVLKKKVQ